LLWARKIIQRGNFTSATDLEEKIIAFIENYNEHLTKPYKWTYTRKPLAAGKEAA